MNSVYLVAESVDEGLTARDGDAVSWIIGRKQRGSSFADIVTWNRSDTSLVAVSIK